ncbi:MAG: AbrB/MazE/SpoVT family DNA-binding domain-containing protein [Proteobacteria bacterium]|nr:AbrB/MazE/SpoVT family DNA-binding domain-containing protein [Pseudomonadota bacterium]
MAIVTSTVKGQILIPVGLRKKFGIVKGTQMNIYEEENRIIVEPIKQEPVQAGRGILKTEGRVLKHLIADRKEEADR